MSVLEEDLLYCAQKIPSVFYGTNFFVTGSTGLIGSLLVKSILKADEIKKAGINVYALARSPSKVDEVFSSYESNPYLHFVYGDVLSPVILEDKIDYIVHAASQTASKEMVLHPVETSKVALDGTMNMLDFAVSKKVRGFVYLSSMEAFGKCSSKEERLSENDLGKIDLTSVRSCYSESKRMCELLCTCYAQETGLDVKIARLAQVFGAGISKNENRVFAQFAFSALNGKDIVLHTDGTSWGNYCYTSDVISALFTILEKGKSAECYTVVNEETSRMIKDMASLVIKVSGNSTSKLVFDIPKDEAKFGYAPKTEMKLSSEKLRSLGWSVNFSLEEMYKRLFSYIKEEF